MRWKMLNVAVVAVTVTALLLVTGETVLAAGGGGGGGGVSRHRAAANRQQDFEGDEKSSRTMSAATTATYDPHDSDERPSRTAATTAGGPQQNIGMYDQLPQTPGAVQCSSCLAHKGIKKLSIELIKLSILNKLGMEKPPEFNGKKPPVVPNDLPPLQELMHRYNNERLTTVPAHIRHKGHHADTFGADGVSGGVGGYDSVGGQDNMQSDEATGDVDDDDYHVRTHKLIAFAQTHPTTAKMGNQHLLFFTFSDQTVQHRITNAVLWLHKKRVDLAGENSPIIFEVKRIDTVNNHSTSLTNVTRVYNSSESRWVALHLKKYLTGWFENPTKNLTLIVIARYQHNKNLTKIPFVTDARKKDDMTQIPYLEIHTLMDRKSRAKRDALLGLTCNETSNETHCCRYPLTIDFEEFGWDWILSPKKYDANYCSGTCEPMLFPTYVHTHLVQMTKVGPGPCCAPRKMSSLALLYYDVDGSIILGILPGMVVDMCGCS